MAALIGLDAMRARLREELAACVAEGRTRPHVLLSGPSGVGKTLLAEALTETLAAREGVEVHRTRGDLLEDVPALVDVLTGMEEGDWLQIDDVEAVPRAVLPMLVQAMQEGVVSVWIEGVGADGQHQERTIRLHLPAFTVVATTRHSDDLSHPLWECFAPEVRLPFYSFGDLARILIAEARRLDLELQPAAAWRMAECAHGTPVMALSLLETVMEFLEIPASPGSDLDGGAEGIVPSGQARSRRVLAWEPVADLMDEFGCDEFALSELQQHYLQLVRSRMAVVPVGWLAEQLGCQVEWLEREVEPYLFHLGLVEFVPGGRLAGPGLARVQGFHRAQGFVGAADFSGQPLPARHVPRILETRSSGQVPRDEFLEPEVLPDASVGFSAASDGDRNLGEAWRTEEWDSDPREEDGEVREGLHVEWGHGSRRWRRGHQEAGFGSMPGLPDSGRFGGVVFEHPRAREGPA